METSLHPSPEQEAIIASRRADPGGSLRVVAFAGSGKTTALRLLAQVATTPALYITYNNTGLSNSDGRVRHSHCRLTKGAASVGTSTGRYKSTQFEA